MERVMVRFFCVVSCGFLAISCCMAAERAAVRYSLDILNPAQHLAQVSVTFPAVEQGMLQVQLPAWRTGKYKILNFSSGIGQLQALGAAGQSLLVNKTDKSTWQVQVDSAQSVRVSYTLYADQLESRTRHIDDTHVFLDAASGLMYVEALRDYPVMVDLQVPQGWMSRSGMQKTAEHQFYAENYDVLVDSPIESGVHAYHEFESDGKPYALVIWGRGNQDEQALIQDLRLIAAETGKLWGGYSFDRYVWMLHLYPGGRGATEHLNSTVIDVDRFKFSPRKDYLDFLSTAAHEFVHTWNVKAYRPTGIARYDYQHENYTPLLWLVEGSTSYFATLLLARAGVIDGQEFLAEWAKDLQQHFDRPGRGQQSPADASFDAWLGESAQWEHNEKADIYTQGLMVSWLLDAKIRESTAMQKGYADVHRLLYKRFPVAQGGYTERDVVSLLSEVANQDMASIWARYVEGRAPVDVDALLGSLGLRVQYGKADKDKTGRKDPAALWTGIHFNESSRDAKIERVQRDSPGWHAGLTAGDEIVALNSDRVLRDAFASRIKDYKPGDSLTVHYFRRERLQSTLLRLIDRSGEELRLVPVESPSAQQKRFFEAWSGIRWNKLKVPGTNKS